MTYSTGMLHWIVTILQKKDPANRKFGETTEYEPLCRECYYAALAEMEEKKATAE